MPAASSAETFADIDDKRGQDMLAPAQDRGCAGARPALRAHNRSRADHDVPVRHHGATHGKAPAGFAPIAIGLCLTQIHLFSIPVANTPVNPARSTGPALFVGGLGDRQFWLFWISPTLGGAAGGLLYRWLSDEPSAQVTGSLPNRRGLTY